MEKNIIYLLVLLLIISGCNKKEENKEENKNEEIIEVNPTPIEEPKVEEYKDNNNTPIAIYRNNNRINTYSGSFTVGKDIGMFKIYLSVDDHISLNGSFGESFYNKWNEYNKDGNLKLGFNISYDIADGRHVSQNILHVNDTYDYQGYILEFLYDDYDLNKYNKVYSHLKPEQETENSLFSSIKLYPQSAYPEITSKILLTVFTYDGEDDFDENNEYRGNSKYTITICDTNKTC